MFAMLQPPNWRLDEPRPDAINHSRRRTARDVRTRGRPPLVTPDSPTPTRNAIKSKIYADAVRRRSLRGPTLLHDPRADLSPDCVCVCVCVCAFGQHDGAAAWESRGRHSVVIVSNLRRPRTRVCGNDCNMWMRSAYLFYLPNTDLVLFRSTLLSRPNKVGLKCPSARPSAKSFFDFNEIWYVGRGRWVMHDDMQCECLSFCVTWLWSWQSVGVDRQSRMGLNLFLFVLSVAFCC